ncbi:MULTISPECIES: DUF1129 domain-containing protein [unclassified Streptococcus]|uniref:DUF1129 domain-containing protein n=1 Tax=unclassified Streptococcus TaxID=2608887 RepID=UPI00359E54E4
MSQLEQLTKKNQEFIHIATKQLIKDGKSDDEIKAILEDILPTIIEAQQTGETARHLLGAPTVWAVGFSQPEISQSAIAEKNTNPYLMWLDMTLLLIAVIALLNAATTLFSKEALPTKLVSLLVLAMLGGVAMYLNYHFIYRYMGLDRSQRPPMFKSLLILVTSMALWITISSATALLPDSINITLPLPVLLVLAAIGFGARYYLKRKYNIQNAMAPAGK